MTARVHLHVDIREGDSWPLTLTHYDGGGPAVVLRARAAIDRQRLLAESAPQAYGEILGRALLGAPALQAAFARARRAAGARLTVLLDLFAPDLIDLHWERLCLPVDDGRWVMAALDQRFCYARYLPGPVDRPYEPAPASAAALLLVASPDGLARYQLAPFDAAATASGLRAAIGPRRCDVLGVGAGTVGPPTLDALCARLTERYYPLLHIVCHGRLSREGEPLLYLADSAGQVDPVPISRLRDRLDQIGDAAHRPLLIFLMSCAGAAPAAEAAFGGAARHLVTALGTPAVVAMTDRISVGTAEELAEQFYRGLYRYGEPNRALTEARAGLAGRADVSVASLYTRLEGQPIIVPSWPLWQRALIAAGAAGGVLLASLAMLYLFAFEPIVAWAASSFAPAGDMARPIRVAYSADPACASAASLEQTLRGAFGERAALRQLGVQIAPRGGGGPPAPDLLVDWGCATAGQPVALRITFAGQPATPVALFEEPGQLDLAVSNPQARTLSRAAALYAAGAYPAALEELGSYGQQPESVDLAWLRASLLLRAERWAEAGALLAQAAARASGERRAALLGNQAAVSLYAREAQGLIDNNPQDCAAGGREAIEQALAMPGLAAAQRARLTMLSGWRLTLCPQGDLELFEDGPALLAAARELAAPGHPLHPIWAALAADNLRLQDLDNDDMQGQVEDLALEALAALPGLPRAYRTLGLLYADTRRMAAARGCFAGYAASAALPYQRREALYLSLSSWKWQRPAIRPRSDLRVCPAPAP